MRRRPFSENIHRGIVVTPVCRATVGACPHAVFEGNLLVETAAGRTQLSRREPWADVLDDGAGCAGDVAQDVYKTGKAQVRHLTAPQGFHTLQVEGFHGDSIVLSTQRMRQLPMKRLALVGNALMDTVKMQAGLMAIAGTLPLL